MRMATCICGEHGSVNVQGPTYGRSFGRGAMVDLDEKVAPGSDLTWGDAIGEAYAHLFEEVAGEGEPKRSLRRERSADVAEAIAAHGTRSDDVRE